MVEARKGYETVYWGKMPINFRPKDFSKHEVEGAVDYAERSFRDVLDLVPDFSALTLGAGPEGDTEAVLVLGEEEARVFRRASREDGGLEGLLWEISVRVRARGRRGTRRERARTG
ncbi:MAG TPA: hypothetical protein VGV91_09450 [Rubrobacter sp.]|nr:hypothetical protein [Rubrobacter sp.]